MTFALARLPLARLARTPRPWIVVLVWALVGVTSAVIARKTGSGTGADHVMRGAFAAVVLPLVSYVIVGAALGGVGLKRAVRGLVAIGGAPRKAALAATLVAALASAVVCALLAALLCAIAHGSGDAPLVNDLAASIGVSALGGATYAAYFSAGSAIGKGAMRSVFLVIDWLFGAGAGVSALLVPRGAVTALLGGPLVADLGLRATSVVLVLQLVLFSALATWLARRA